MLIRSIGAQWVIEVRPHKGELCPQPYTGISIQGKYCRGGQRQQGLSGWRMRARHPAEPWGLELLAQHRLFQTGKPQSTTVRLGLNINPTLTDSVHLSPCFAVISPSEMPNLNTHIYAYKADSDISALLFLISLCAGSSESLRSLSSRRL